MLNFNFSLPTDIVFGKGKIEKVGTEIKKRGGSKVLIVFGSDRIKTNGLFDETVKYLKEAGLEYQAIGGVEPNPRVTSVRDGIELCRKHDLDYILAIGGGSVIDAAKAMAFGCFYDGDVWDFFLRKTAVDKALPIAAVLTLSATGSEMNGNTVISNLATEQKLPVGHPILRPQFSILDPEYTYTVPKYHTAAGTVDIMSHVFEQFFSAVKDTYIQDRMAEAMLTTCLAYGRIAMDDPENFEARANLMWTGTLALNGLLSAGKMGDWAVHQIEHEVSAIYDITHGVGLAIITPNWMEYVLSEDNVDKFYSLAVNVFGVVAHADKMKVAKDGIQALRTFFKSIDIPTTLTEMNIGDDKLEEMAAKSVAYGDLGTFRSLNKSDVLHILKQSL